MKLSYRSAWLVGIYLCSLSILADPTLSNSLVGVQGYDPVAYYIDSKPIRGNGNYTHKHEGVTYIFTSPENQIQFKQNPEKYIPQYGGFCAFAITKNKKVVGDPLAWKIVNNRLYLNLNKKVQAYWEKDMQRYIREADEIWPNLKNQE